MGVVFHLMTAPIQIQLKVLASAPVFENTVYFCFNTTEAQFLNMYSAGLKYVQLKLCLLLLWSLNLQREDQVYSPHLLLSESTGFDLFASVENTVHLLTLTFDWSCRCVWRFSCSCSVVYQAWMWFTSLNGETHALILMRQDRYRQGSNNPTHLLLIRIFTQQTS